MPPSLSGSLPPTLAAIGACTALLAGALLWPSSDSGEPPGAPVRAVLVDASASVARRRPARLRTVRDRLGAEAVAAAAAGEEVLVVAFAEEAARLLGPAPPDTLLAALAGDGRAPLDPSAPGGRDAGTRLAAALELAAGAVLAADRRPGRVVVLSDGTFTGPDPGPALSALRAGGAAVEWVPPGPATLADVALLGARLPGEVAPGAPLGVTLHYRLDPGAADPARLALFAEVLVRGEDGVPVDLARARLALPAWLPGEAAAVVPIAPATEGVVRVEVALVLEHTGGGRRDPVPENDRSAAATRVGDARAVGVVAARGAEVAAAALAADLAAALPGMAPRALALEGLGDSLADLDALVLVDPSPDDLPGALLAGWVEGGGGLLVLLGWGALEAWSGEPAADPRALWPLEPDPGRPGLRDVILLVDGSGSMEGEPISAVRRAAAELVAAAPSRDEVRLRFFTARLDRGSTLLKGGGEEGVGRGAALERALGARVPRGPTQIVESLEQLAGEREYAPREALVLLLSDGRESSELLDAEARAAEVRARLEGARARLAVVAAGPRADLALLELLSGPEPPARAEDLSGLDEIFRREVNRERVREGEPLVLQVRAPTGPDDPGLALLGGEPPPVRRVLRAGLRPGAELIWTDDEGAPVLAAWRRGRGWAAALSTQPAQPWAPELGRGVGSLGPLLRTLAGSPGDVTPRARLDRDRVVLEALGTAPVRTRARVLLADGRPVGELVLSADPTAPDRRVAAAPAWLRGRPAGELLVLVLDDGRAAALPLPVGGEWRHPPARVQPAPGGPIPGGAAPREPEGAAHGAGAPLLAVSLFALLAAAVLRARGQAAPLHGR